LLYHQAKLLENEITFHDAKYETYACNGYTQYKVKEETVIIY